METEFQPKMPEQIGRFKLIDELGEGAMSVVYKAFDPEINRNIAIKLLRGECAADPEYRYRFLQEAKAAGKLTHPNIVTIFDVGEAPEGPYIAMEYLEGMTLQEVMASGNLVTLRDKVVYGIQLAEALAYSHASSVVHRDVKPSNIMLSENGQNVRITDFGIAHIETPNKEQRTQLGAVLGTPQYMSPEQVEGQLVDGRSDLFSLGVILYQLITGEKPFVAKTLTTLLMEIVQKEPESINRKAPQAPESLQRAVEKLMRKRPEQRFQSGKEVADALRHVVLEMDEKEEHKSEAGILPLRVKWTAVMAVVVSVSMLLGSYFVYKKQVQAMTELAVDSGGSLAEFIAIESAEAVLIQDWIAIEAFVSEVKERQQISYLKILDHKGILRGSTSAEEVGSESVDRAAPSPIWADGEVVYVKSTHNGEAIFDFKVPILFQHKTIGSMQLGLSQAPLIAAANLTLYTMLGLLVAVVLTVIIVAYLLAAGITLPLKSLKRAIAHVIHENYSYRIEEKRNDEFGQLFSEYNRMADSLSNREEERAAAAIEASGAVQQSDDSDESVEGEDGTQPHSYDPTRVIAKPKANWSPDSDNTEPDLLAEDPTMIIRPNKNM
ncbi:MAG: protein kinase [Gammaproteobacteria bacterium]|nr:protein kinase [Gammaproteobacteria bacterium]